ncbi:M23 family metallopeptidase [Streptomyces sp. NBC_01142]|uniref:M23 family metallopeptidase n=1 Tax=Streptomyces sp. NBC_01142 TaxID=2975865 RepID=UPI00225A468B|nr:M23 family metallopeptidase [Streptomyces sp. NBC_01142]MCX4818829.1 M23 family metallopeptidase [Streptomyces sp. NBC_01142]
MNDQHAHAGYVGYDGYSTGSFDTDPLFGALPGSYEAGHSGQYDASQWGTGSHQTAGSGSDVYAAQQEQSTQQAQQPQYDTTGQWDADAWNQTTQTGQYETAAATFAYDTTGQWAAPTFETGAYDATAWNSGAESGYQSAYNEAVVPHQFTPEQEFIPSPESAATDFTTEFSTEFVADAGYESAAEFQGTDLQADPQPEFEYQNECQNEYEFEYESAAEHEPESEPEPEADSGPEVELLTAAVPVTPRPVRRSGGSRGRRRTPAKRSALLTVAVPSACVMGVAGIAAASVGGLGATGGETKDETTSLAAADPASVKPVAANNKMDTQLANLSADARDFGDRASRTQERIDLKARQAAEKKKREEEAERREALRPKFMLPVKQDGLSAYYGQAGVNWMSVHTGIDFPVSYGTEVMAATDGTVRTQWNSAYGNMAIVTAADGTETWYCHLSSTKIRSGSVKAGDVIAYSGNSGNSTGPHLHFEVRPGGGSAIDPLPWLRSHGLNPT